MRSFFSIESPLYRFLTRFSQMLLLNLLWILFSLPIVTVGASTAAAFYTARRIGDDQEGYMFQTFLEGFRTNWKQGTLLGLMTAAGVYVCWIDWQIAHAEESVLWNIIFIVTCVLVLCGAMYAWPLIVRYRNGLLKTVQNSFEIATRYPGSTILIGLVCVLEAVLLTWNTTLLFFGILVGVPVLIYTVDQMSKKIFQKIEKDWKSGTVDAR